MSSRAQRSKVTVKLWKLCVTSLSSCTNVFLPFFVVPHAAGDMMKQNRCREPDRQLVCDIAAGNYTSAPVVYLESDLYIVKHRAPPPPSVIMLASTERSTWSREVTINHVPGVDPGLVSVDTGGARHGHVSVPENGWIPNMTGTVIWWRKFIKPETNLYQLRSCGEVIVD